MILNILTFIVSVLRGLAEKTVDDKRFCGLGRRYLEDYISAVRPLCRAAANAKETDLQTIIFMNRNTLCIRFFYMNCTISVNTTTIAAEIPKMGGGIAMKATGIVRRIDYPVIIRQSQETQINQWFSLILSKENLLESSYHGILKR